MARSSRPRGLVAAAAFAAVTTSLTAAALAEEVPRGKDTSSLLLAPNRRGATLTWDLNVEGAVGWQPETGDVVGFGRVRAGLAWILNPGAFAPVRFWSLSAFYDLSNLSPATIGIQAESLSLGSGTWVQLGGMMDLQARSGGVMLAGGLSILGIEIQRRFYEDNGHGPIWALYGKIRVPISIIAFALAK